MLQEIELHARRGENFGFETTLSGRNCLDLIRQLRQQGYEVHLFLLWLPTIDVALSRIKDRVLKGGHHVPESVVRRRFDRSLHNFLLRYRSLASTWLLFDNSGTTPEAIAIQDQSGLRIINGRLFNLLMARYGAP